MNDAISRSAVQEVVKKAQRYVVVISDTGRGYDGAVLIDEIMSGFNKLPALDVAPVVHAHWIMVEKEAFWIGDEEIWMETGKPTKRLMPVCSHCKKEFGTAAQEFNFCPNCGARMDGEAE